MAKYWNNKLKNNARVYELYIETRCLCFLDLFKYGWVVLERSVLNKLINKLEQNNLLEQGGRING